jgi:hypothetical protein
MVILMVGFHTKTGGGRGVQWAKDEVQRSASAKDYDYNAICIRCGAIEAWFHYTWKLCALLDIITM